MSDRPRGLAFTALAAFFALYVLFLYGPTLTILALSFQGPQGGLTFPMNGVSTHWFGKLWAGGGIVDIWAAFGRSLRLGFVVMVLTVVLAFFAGLAFRKGFRGANALFAIAVASLIVPSIVVSLGIGLEFRLVDDAINALAAATGWGWLQDHGTAMGLYSSALGAHLTWTLPFGLLIMFAVFNRFDPAYEEAARDLGATGAQTLRHVVVPILAPALVGVALFGFTLSFDELARTSQAIGGRNSLPLELQGLTTTVTTPEIYALGSLTTAVSALVIGTALAASLLLQRRRARRSLAGA
ncbi:MULTISPECIES: ABC transporter permease [unclassified Methylobacterium]|uniref:ABC transporter permease n=1 Tax=unclassified Methylobacterium TaxID=2615210 RepID=UPI0011CC9A17|nr:MULTISPECIES: ABC transporter permease [unclassified Methylobacterium]TXM76797.1 ABC transporter permease [Methylobacterium sp. WL12]TXN05353.1 ABC transporter permease [Methylobacterium sp. WL122]TXN80674.1 ABC transporter permease [Methylobacterium sp. WL8]